MFSNEQLAILANQLCRASWLNFIWCKAKCLACIRGEYSSSSACPAKRPLTCAVAHTLTLQISSSKMPATCTHPKGSPHAATAHCAVCHSLNYASHCRACVEASSHREEAGQGALSDLFMAHYMIFDSLLHEQNHLQPIAMGKTQTVARR